MNLRSIWREVFPNTSRADLVKDDSEAHKYLKSKERRIRSNKITLVVFIVVAVAVVVILYNADLITRDTLGTVMAAVIGGFIGAAINYVASAE